MHKRLLPLFLLAVSVTILPGCNPDAPSTNAVVAAPVATPLPTGTTGPTNTPTNTPLSTNTPEPTETSWPTSVVPKSILYNIHEIEDQAAGIRGLVVKEDVPQVFITSQQLHDYFAAHVGKGYSIEEAQQDEMEAWLMRLISKRDVNLKETAVEVHIEGILGFYSPDIKELFVLGDAKNMSPQSKETLAHEFTHALQDQHFGLTKLIQQENQDSDRRLAIRSLIEGDAEVTGLTYSYNYPSKADSPEQKQASPKTNAEKQTETEAGGQGAYIGKTIYFPYIQGSQFILDLTKVAGFSAVNGTYQDPPISSEQILHPEKYIQTPHDLPMTVELPPLTSTLGAGWTLKHQDTAGEWELRMILEETRTSGPEDAAAGWGGGKYSYYSKGEGQGLIFMHTRWDTPKDADEFEAAMREGLDKLAKKEGTVWTEGGRYFSLKHVGSHIFYIASTDRNALEAAWQMAK